MKKKITAITLSAVMALSLTPMSAFATLAEDAVDTPSEIEADYSWYSATATELTIEDKGDLVGFAKLTQGAVENVSEAATYFAGQTVKLAADIAFEDGEYWCYNDGENNFANYAYYLEGIFDGQGHTISNLQFYNASTANPAWGLFYEVKAGATVKDLTLENVTATVNDSDYIAALAYKMFGTADNCDVNGMTVTVNNSTGAARVDGIANQTKNSKVSDCDVDGMTVVASGMLIRSSAIAGQEGGGSAFSNCTAKDITMTSEYTGNEAFYMCGGIVGGIVGSNTTLTDCTVENIAMISKGNMQMIGGAIGMLLTNTIVTNVDVTKVRIATETSLSRVGGMFGLANAAGISVSGCDLTTVSISGGDGTYVGGYIGNTSDSGGDSYINCSATNVTLTLTGKGTAVGGFAGESSDAGAADAVVSFSGCSVSDLDMTVAEGVWGLGGFVGSMTASVNATGCSVSGTVVVEDGDTAVGGFTGDTGTKGGTHTLTNCVADVDVTASGDVGGFIGTTQSAGTTNVASNLVITDSVATGNVTSTEGVAGGFVGTADRGVFEDCQASGDVSGDVVGGFIGAIIPNTTKMENVEVTVSGSSVSGVVTGESYASGFVGTITTADEDNNNAISVTISNSTTTADVVAKNEDTVVSEFANDITESEDSNYTEEGVVVNVAKIGEVGYATLQEAINNASAGEEIKLVANTAETGITVATDDDVVINLNGKTVTGDFMVYGKATIQNGTIINTAVVSGIESNGASADLTVENLTVTSNRHALRIDGGKAHIISGTYTSTADGISCYAVNAGGDGATELIIDGGVFTSSENAATYGTALMLKNSGVTTTVNGGVFNSASIQSFENYGSMTINDGTFKAGFVANDTTVIYGGTFEKDPSAYLAEGIESVLVNGTYVIQTKRAFVVTANKSEVAAGEEVTVTVALSGTALVGAKWTLVYDNTKFELVGGEANGEIKGEAYAGTRGAFNTSEVLATYTFKAIVQQPDGIASVFTVESFDAWNIGEANSHDDDPIPCDVTPAEVTVIAPVYELSVKLGEDTDYVAGKKLVIIYTNIDTISFNYVGATMYDTSAKYTKEGYTKSFAIVVDAIAEGTVEDYAANVEIEYSTVNEEYVLSGEATYDLNGSGEFNLRDVTAAYGVYNGEESTFAEYMNIVLNADVDHNGCVDANDAAAFVDAYTAVK